MMMCANFWSRKNLAAVIKIEVIAAYKHLLFSVHYFLYLKYAAKNFSFKTSRLLQVSLFIGSNPASALELVPAQTRSEDYV
jgi:hypothetical protein